MESRLKGKGTERHIVGEVERFDQKHEMYKRPFWDESVKEIGDWSNIAPSMKRPGYTIQDLAYRDAGWYVAYGDNQEETFGRHKGLYAWQSEPKGDEARRPAGLKVPVDNPARMSHAIKKVSKFYGASDVGICELDRRWLYSYSYYPYTEEYKPVEIPSECTNVISLVFEMNYEYFHYSPTNITGATTGFAYSQMAFTAGLLAQFIRRMGYQALPMGNDTALSIPFAVDAGLGELSRAGILITPKFGPRIRLAKVVTDLPLSLDEPINFGIWDFCLKCEKCAQFCPGKAINSGDPTTEIHNISNNKGLYRWPLNAEKCLNFWKSNTTECGNCIRVCPFNKPLGWLHDLTRWGIKNASWMNSFFVQMDDLFGYGRQKKPDHFWNE